MFIPNIGYWPCWGANYICHIWGFLMKNASFVRRFLGLVADLSIAITLFFYLFSFEIFGEVFSDIAHEFAKLETGIPAGPVVTALLFYFIHMNLRFFQTLLIGVSFGQYLAGISAGGNGFWKRVGGGARVLFELILSPFLIFDFPVLFSRRSLKEVLTFTALWPRPGILVYLTTVIFVPCLIFLALISPLFENLTLLDGVSVSFEKAKKEELENKTNFTNFKNYQSNFFHFSFFSSLGDGRYKIIPSYIVEKINGKGVFTPFLSIYDTKDKVEFSLKSLGNVSLLDKLDHAKSFNPLFYARHPELAKELARGRSVFQRKNYNSGFGNKMLFSREVRGEVKHLVSSAFELSILKIFDHVMINGPFIKGHVEVRNKLLGLIQYEEPPIVSLAEYGDHNFVVFTEEKQLDKKVVITEHFLGIESPEPILFQLKAEFNGTDEVAEKSFNEFKKYILASSNWYFDYDNMFSIPLTKAEFGPLSIMDFIFDHDIVPDKRKILENYTYHYFFDLALAALKSKDPVFLNVVSAALNRQFLAGKIEWNRKVINSEYLGHMKTLRIALKNKDMAFFRP